MKSRVSKPRKSLTRWFLPLALIALCSTLWLHACSSPGNKKVDEACKDNNECTAGLLCSSGKCVEAIKPPDPRKPLANAGPDFDVKTGEKVTLDGSKSTTFVDGKALTYIWSLTKGPDGSTAKLEGETTATASLTPDKEGTYTVTLVVDDGQKSEADEVTIVATRANTAPTADAGTDIRIELGQSADLDASKSTDAEKDTLTYKWELTSKPDGSAKSIDDDAAEKTKFTPDKIGVYGIKLTVNDGKLSSSASIVLEVVANNPKPELTKLNPDMAPTKAKAYMIEIEGKHFLQGAKVFIADKEAAATQYAGPEKLVATLDLSAASAGEVDITVKNPDEKTSDALKLKIEDAPKPTIDKVNPDLIITRQSLRFTIEGTGFLNGAKVSFDGKDLETTFDSDKSLFANLDQAPDPGKYNLVVTNPDGQASDPVELVVTGVQAVLANLSHENIGSDCAKEIIVVSGRNILPNATGELILRSDPTKKYPAVKSTVRSSTTVELEFDFTKIPKGDYDLTITNPNLPPSLPLAFSVTDPPGKPEILSVFPSKLFVGGVAKAYITGINLDKSTSALIGAQKFPSKKINETTYEVTLDASKLTQPGKLSIMFTASCQRSTAPVEVEVVEEGTPKIYTATPNSLEIGKQVDVVLAGEGFGVAPTVTINGTAATKIDRRNSFEIVIPKSNFATKGKYKIVVENKGSKKSNEIEIEVTDAFPIKIEELRKSGTSIYIKGKGLRTDTDPGKDGTLTLFVFDGTTETCRTGGVSIRDSSNGTEVYASLLYSTSSSTSTSRCSSPLDRSKTLLFQIKKSKDGTDYLSNKFPFSYDGGGSTTNPNTSQPGPYATTLNPSSVTGTNNNVIEIKISGGNFGSSTDPVDFYLDGTKVDTTADTNYSLTHSTSTVTVNISRPPAGVHTMEVSTKHGKSNTLFFNADATETVRVKSTGLNAMIFENDSARAFYLYGDNLDYSKHKINIAGKDYTPSSSSSTKPYKLYYYMSSTTLKALNLNGEVKVYATDGTNKSNELTFRAINPGAWGTVPLVLRSLRYYAGATVGDELDLRVAHTGFVEKDANGKQGEILINGKATTDYTSTSSTSYYTYLRLTDYPVDKPGVWTVQLKNPDGKLSNKTFITVRKPGELLLEDIYDSYYYSKIVRTGEVIELRLYSTGFTDNTMVYFAGRPMQITDRSSSYLEANIDARGMSTGLQPIWLQDKDKGTSNSILVRVMPKEGTGDAPKFEAVSPTYLEAAGISLVGGKVRFAVDGTNLSDELELVVGTKTAPLKTVSSSRAIAEIDLTGVAAGSYEVYLKDKTGTFQSPKVKIEIK